MVAAIPVVEAPPENGSVIMATQFVESSQTLSFPEDGTWFVLHTKSRNEKILADELVSLEIGCFLPLSRQVRFYGNRKAVILEPMFSGYMFLRGAIEDAYKADRTRRLASLIRVTDQRQLDSELRNLHLALSEKGILDPHPAVRRGVRVEVRSGPFRGLQGVVEDRVRRDRIILKVAILGRAVSMEIDPGLLDVID